MKGGKAGAAVGAVLWAVWTGVWAQTPAEAPQAPRPAPVTTLRIDPRMIAEASEAWDIIGNAANPIWPGWNASPTPILFYLPGVQDVLINHPAPPAGFAPYTGPLRFPGGRIVVKEGPTLMEWDGQNTAIEVGGIETLVLADTQSNLRVQIGGLLEDPRPVAEKMKDLTFPRLATDPYDQLCMIVHEAFHVFQASAAPDKVANEMLLVHYPVLSAENNAGFAQEGAALAEALRAQDPATFRRAVVRWVALRSSRRAKLSQEAIEYEDGVEFLEGLAKYTEYRLLQVLETRTPRADLWWVQGFEGYGNLGALRGRLLDQMVQHMRGEASVNNDPYGTAPLRMRLYYSGMALAAVLDRLSPDWKRAILKPEVSLTDLVREGAGASQAELEAALKEARADKDYPALLEAKNRLAREGRMEIDGMLARIERGEGTGILLDYGELPSLEVAMAFTPFGIRVVDGDRTIYTMVPVQVRFADKTVVAQTEPSPLLQDKKARRVQFRLSKSVSPQEVESALGSEGRLGQEIAGLTLDLPGMTLRAANATLRWEGKDLRITLRPAGKAGAVSPSGAASEAGEPGLRVDVAAPLAGDRGAYEKEVLSALADVAAVFRSAGLELPAGQRIIEAVTVFEGPGEARAHLAKEFGAPVESIPETFSGTVIDTGLFVVSREAYRRIWETLYPDWPWTDETYHQLLVHELTHRAHEMLVLAQFGSADAMGPTWFFEGFAVFCAGQFEDSRPLMSRAEIEAQVGPGQTPKVSYPLYGRLVRSLVAEYGIKTLITRAAEPGFPGNLWVGPGGKSPDKHGTPKTQKACAWERQEERLVSDGSRLPTRPTTVPRGGRQVDG